jgi:hypothetical protein
MRTPSISESETQRRKKNQIRKRAEKIMELLRGDCRKKCAYLDWRYFDQVTALESEGLVAYELLRTQRGLPKIKVWALACQSPTEEKP